MVAGSCDGSAISRDDSAIIFRVKLLLELYDPEDAGTLILLKLREQLT
jgi:hypothetical protein